MPSAVPDHVADEKECTANVQGDGEGAEPAEAETAVHGGAAGGGAEKA